MIGLVVGGVASGVGKTTLTLGLIGALRQRGLLVQPFKVGPDYIDPSQHTQAAGRPSRNLDSWLLPEPALCDLFGRAATRVDAAIVEGVMGLFDGRSGSGEIGSTAHVAKLLDLPVLLVVDAAKAARSIAAVVLGCRTFDPKLRIVGVVLNNVGSEAHARAAAEPIEREAGLPVLGWLPRDPELRQEERYLGLVPAGERRLPAALLERAKARVAEHINLDRLLTLATIKPSPSVDCGLFPAESVPPRARLAVAQDAAFGFYYQDSLDLLEAWGAELVPFSPLSDDELPAEVDGVYLGGGFPELFARELSENDSMLASLRMHAERGGPLYAECGGLMYLQHGLVDHDDKHHPMTGLLPGWSTMERARLTLGYREATALGQTLLLDAGARVRGHEFHWSIAEAPPTSLAAYELAGDPPRLEGYATGNVLASYLHLHFGSDAGLAPRFVEACARFRGPPTPLPPPPVRGRGRACGSLSSREEAGERIATAPEVETVAAGPLLLRYGLPPSEIEGLSHRRIVERIGERLPSSEPEQGLVARLVYAAGDPDLVDNVVVQHAGIKAATDALRRGAAVVVDVRMVAAGVSKAVLDRLGCQLLVALDAPGADLLAADLGITRTAAGILVLADRLDGAVVAVGNAPTALLAVLDLVNTGIARPAAVVGMPVGFVAAAESKALLLETDLPSIAITGTRGGSGLAAAAVNYLVRLAGQP
jgi:cobyrinic acid a,c-diamide synthase